MRLVGYECASLQVLNYNATHTPLHVTLLNGGPGARDVGQGAAICEQTPSVNEDGGKEGQQVGAGDDEDVKDLAMPKGLVDLVPWGDEHETREQEGEEGECGAVKYAEEWDVHCEKGIVIV